MPRIATRARGRWAPPPDPGSACLHVRGVRRRALDPPLPNSRSRIVKSMPLNANLRRVRSTPNSGRYCAARLEAVGRRRSCGTVIKNATPAAISGPIARWRAASSSAFLVRYRSRLTMSRRLRRCQPPLEAMTHYPWESDPDAWKTQADGSEYSPPAENPSASRSPSGASAPSVSRRWGSGLASMSACTTATSSPSGRTVRPR